MHAEASQVLVGLYIDCENKDELLADVIDAHVENMI